MWIWFRMIISDRSGGICVFYSSQSAAHLEEEQKKKKVALNKKSNYRISWVIGNERVYIMLKKAWSFSVLS